MTWDDLVAAVVAAARNVEWADHDHYQRNPRAHMEHLRTALKALDEFEKREGITG